MHSSMQNFNIPKQFFSSQASQVEVADIRVDHDQDAEHYTDQGHGDNQNPPHLK